MRRFDSSDRNVNEMRDDLANIGENMDAHAISIKHLNLKMSHLSTTVNKHQPVACKRNTIKNPKNDGH